jgi:hypothetical protein
MAEVVVGRFEDETEAEVANASLRADGLHSRVSYLASLGAPRPMAPTRVIAPFGMYEVVVPADEVDAAIEALRAAGPAPPRPRRFRWLGMLLVIGWLLPLLISAVFALVTLFRGGPR